MVGLLELRRRKLQFSLIGLVVTLISYLVLMINGLGVGLNEAAGSALRNFDADAIAYSDRAGLSVIRSELSAADVDAAAGGPGVADHAPLGYVAASFRDASDEVDSAAFLGYVPGTIGEPDVVAGRTLGPDDRHGLLADRQFLRTTGFEVGDTVTVSLRLTTQEFTIVGEIDEGAFFFQPAVYLLLDSWRELKYGDAPESEQPAASIVLLKGDNVTGRFDTYEAVDKSTAFANIEGVSGQQSTVVALRMFGYLIGALVIGVFFYVLTLQKLPQIGMLKAVGASNAFIFRQMLLQVLVIAGIGVAVSVPLAYLTDAALQQASTEVPVAFTAGTYITTSLALMTVAVVGALVSGRQVLRVDPIIALGQQQI